GYSSSCDADARHVVGVHCCLSSCRYPSTASQNVSRSDCNSHGRFLSVVTPGCHLATCPSDKRVSIMAYTVPTFNLTCNLFRYTGAAYVNLFNFPGNLQMGRRVPYVFTGMTDGDNLPLSP